MAGGDVLRGSISALLSPRLGGSVTRTWREHLVSPLFTPRPCRSIARNEDLPCVPGSRRCGCRDGPRFLHGGALASGNRNCSEPEYRRGQPQKPAEDRDEREHTENHPPDQERDEPRGRRLHQEPPGRIDPWVRTASRFLDGMLMRLPPVFRDAPQLQQRSERAQLTTSRRTGKTCSRCPDSSSFERNAYMLGSQSATRYRVTTPRSAARFRNSSNSPHFAVPTIPRTSSRSATAASLKSRLSSFGRGKEARSASGSPNGEP